MKILTYVREGILLGPTFPLRHLSKILGRRYHVASIKGAGKVYMRPNNSDGEVFLKIFGKREYDFSSLYQFSRVTAAYRSILEAGKTPIIIDAGANVGAATIWFSELFPLASIIAVEPDSANAEMCRMNTRTRPNVRVIEAAIGSESGEVSLIFPADNAGWATRTVRNGNTGGVAVKTIPELVSDFRNPTSLLLVKIDIEGFENDLFGSNIGWINEVEVIIIEPHDWLFPGQGTSSRFQRVIGERGFELLISGENLVYVRLPPIARGLE
jgi:FkbM family methyltransferase